MSPRSGTRSLQSFHGLRQWLHRAGTWVLVLTALILPVGCASQESMRPPRWSLRSNDKYRPATPSFLAHPSTDFTPVREGPARLAANQGPGHADVHGAKPVFRPGPPPPVPD